MNQIDQNHYSECYRDAVGISDGLKDAWGQPPARLSGYNGGNFFAEGDRIRCYEIDIPTVYCRTNYKITNPVNFAPSIWYSAEKNVGNRYWMQGICIPESCQIPMSYFPQNFTYQNGDEICDLEPILECEENNSWFDRCGENGDACWLSIAFFVSLLILVIVGTIFKIQYFSIKRTWKDLVNFKPNPKQLNSFNSMRVIALFWVIALHIKGLMYEEPLYDGTWMSANTITFTNQISGTFVNEFGRQGGLSVHTFFVIGGFLASQILYKKLVSMERLCGDKYCGSFWLQICYFFNLMVHRWFRFLPVLVVIVLFSFLSVVRGGGYRHTVTSDIPNLRF